MHKFFLAGTSVVSIMFAVPASAQQSSTTSATQHPTDDPDARDIVVNGQRQDGYRAVDSNALGVGLTLQETPATINVITDTFIRDTGARRLSEIIAYTPGVVNNEKYTSISEYFIIRGFATSLTYLNGVRQTYSNTRRGLATTDRVDIVKGPAGAESGIADPGGTIDILTKQPQATFGASIDAALGDYNYRNLTADVTGPLAFDGKLQARLVAGYQQSVSWRTGQPDHQPFVTVAPSVKFDYAEGGSIYAQYEYNYSNEYFDRGVIHLAGYYPGGFGPRDTSAVNSKLNFATTRDNRFEVGLDQKKGPFTLMLRYQRVRDSADGAQFDAEPTSGDIYVTSATNATPRQAAIDSYTWNGTGYTIPFFYGTNKDYVTRTDNSSASLKADFSVFGIRNTLVGGYDRSENFAGGLSVGPQVSNVLDLRAPNNNQTPVINGPSSLFDQASTEKIDSFYVKWVARPSDRLRLIAAGRWDRYRQGFSFTSADGSGQSDTGTSTLMDNLFSYRVAASFDVTYGVTTFLGYSNGYIPQSGFSRAGAIPALRARSLEAGVKISLAGGKALWTNTVYSIRQDNLTTEDPTNVAPESFVILFGAVRVRGFESELTGRVLPGLDLSAGVSLLQSRILQANDGTQGNRYLNVPAVQASAFASYNLAAVGVKPLTVRLGCNVLGDRQGDNANTFTLPSYFRVDTGFSYALNDRFKAGIAIENLFDKTYYVAADQGGLGGGTVSVGNRRLIQATLGYGF